MKMQSLYVQQQEIDHQAETNQRTSVEVHAPIRMGNMLRMKHLPPKVGMCRTDIYNLIAQGLFPPGIIWCGQRRRAWPESDIDQWLLEQINKSRSVPTRQRRGAK